MNQRPLRIGFSARIHHPEPGATGPDSKSLHFLEQSLYCWVMLRGVMVFMIPSVCNKCSDVTETIRQFDYSQFLDGLILQGGEDICPEHYGEKPLKENWAGDYQHDEYQMALLRQFIDSGKPVLGICRGAQLINVALGGSLYQDISSQYEHPAIHTNGDFDKYLHPIEWERQSWFGRLYPAQSGANVVSIHHQAIKALGTGLRVEARSVGDGVVEAIRLEGPTFVVGLQWHPECHPNGSPIPLNCNPILDEFLSEARRAEGD